MVFKGTYAGYSKLIGDGIIHQRMMTIDPENKQIKITDKIDGRNKHKVQSYIHIHPDFQLKPGNRGIDLMNINTKFIIIPYGVNNYRIEKGMYSPWFGYNKEKDVIVLGGEKLLPTQISYTIDYHCNL